MKYNYLENKNECLNYAKEHMEPNEYKKLARSSDIMEVSDILVCVVLAPSSALYTLHRLFQNGYIVNLVELSISIVLGSIIVLAIGAIISRVVTHTAGRRWADYYVSWLKQQEE